MNEYAPCTILDNPIRVRLFIDDVAWLNKNQIEINLFIRNLVRERIREIKKIRTPANAIPQISASAITGDH